MDSLNKLCLEENEIELYLLKNLPAHSENRRIEHHLNSCSKCKELFSELRLFYHLFHDAQQRPVENKIFRLVKSLEENRIRIAAILLKPQLLDEKPGERHFTSELILAANLNIDQLAKLDYIPLKKDEVLIRVLQATNSQETTLYLYSEDKKLYSEVILKLPEIGEYFRSDEKGKIDVGQRDISNFDRRAVMIISNN